MAILVNVTRLFIAATALSASTLVCAATLDFEDLAPGSFATVAYEGFVFESVIDNEPDYGYWSVNTDIQSHSSAIDGTTELSDGNALGCEPDVNAWLHTNCVVNMEHSSGDLFSLNSVDTGGWGYTSSLWVDVPIRIRGYSAANELVAIEFFIYSDEKDVYGFDFEKSFAFDSTWSNLARVEFEFGQYADAGFVDNINVNVIPIPAAVYLFASGLGLLGWIRRRNQS